MPADSHLAAFLTAWRQGSIGLVASGQERAGRVMLKALETVSNDPYAVPCGVALGKIEAGQHAAALAVLQDEVLAHDAHHAQALLIRMECLRINGDPQWRHVAKTLLAVSDDTEARAAASRALAH